MKVYTMVRGIYPMRVNQKIIYYEKNEILHGAHIIDIDVCACVFCM